MLLITDWNTPEIPAVSGGIVSCGRATYGRQIRLVHEFSGGDFPSYHAGIDVIARAAL